MTLTSFVFKNSFRSRRRSLLTTLSISFSLLLLTIMLAIWGAFYFNQGSTESAQRLISHHRVSLSFFLPEAYREKIRAVPGVKQVVSETWFGGLYKDDKPENLFAQFATDPQEILKVQTELQISPDQVEAWQHDPAGTIVDAQLARKHGWKIGDRIFLKGTLLPVNPELTIRGIFTDQEPTESIFFNRSYIDAAFPPVKGLIGFYAILGDSPESVPRIAKEVDQLFRNSPRPTKTESEKVFQLSLIATLGNVKVFILSICAAVVFTTLLVSANTVAMSIRERTREIAVLRTLGFDRQKVLKLFIAESITLSLIGGLLGCLGGWVLLVALAHSPQGGTFLAGVKVTVSTFTIALVIALAVGLLSGSVPSYNASRRNIVDGLRHIG